MKILDIETDGLLDTVSKVHVVVIKDTVTEHVEVARTSEEIKVLLKGLQNETLIGHNLLGFDLEVLKRFYGFEMPLEQVKDTLILSKLIYPDIRKKDSAVKRLEPRLWGSHSLKAWGYRLGTFKGDFGSTGIDEFKELTQEMIDYCVNDVHLTDILWKNLRQRLPPPEAVCLEHEIAKFQIPMRGYETDVESASTTLL